jgi:hypothetical protein
MTIKKEMNLITFLMFFIPILIIILIMIYQKLK